MCCLFCEVGLSDIMVVQMQERVALVADPRNSHLFLQAFIVNHASQLQRICTTKIKACAKRNKGTLSVLKPLQTQIFFFFFKCHGTEMKMGSFTAVCSNCVVQMPLGAVWVWIQKLQSRPNFLINQKTAT